MKVLKNSIGNEVKIFAQTFENEAYEQIKEIANFEPYLNSKIRVMPDAHSGTGCVVGTTMTISDKITPNLVGVDIGCGMLTIKFKNKGIDFDKLDRVIREKIPSGFNVHEVYKKNFNFENLRCAKYVDLNRAILSIGTLGGGNHFIEIDKDEDTGEMYLVIHSGSRKLGNDICKHYQNKAFQNANSEMNTIIKNLINKLKSEGREKEIESEIKKVKKPPVNKDLAFLSGRDFDDYINDITIAQKFASLNRENIAEIIIKELNLKEIDRFETVHNYIDTNSMILRKGAVSAKKGEALIIPINMRDGALICIGKGNEDWNYSAPHGAGRLMSRSEAIRIITLEEYNDSMKGIYSTSVSKSTLDEAPQAYKPMNEIINAIKDTVEVIKVIRTVYNFKAS